MTRSLVEFFTPVGCVTARTSVIAATLMCGLVASASSLAAQKAPKLSAIGNTSVGTPVMLEMGSVSTANGIVTATVRVKLQPPLKSADGELLNSRTIAMFDCGKKTVATKESWYYLDEAGKKIGMHKVIKQPGFGPAFKGSLADVAMTHLCAAKK